MYIEHDLSKHTQNDFEKNYIQNKKNIKENVAFFY